MKKDKLTFHELILVTEDNGHIEHHHYAVVASNIDSAIDMAKKRFPSVQTIALVIA